MSTEIAVRRIASVTEFAGSCEQRETIMIASAATKGTETCRCACGHLTRADFPQDVAQPVQYGARVLALGVYLRDYQLLPFARTVQLIQDVFGAWLSPGTLTSALKRAATHLQPVSQAIAKALKRARLLQGDETGMRVGGRLHWLHCLSTAALTHSICHAKRGKAGTDAAGMLPEFAGTLVHDGRLVQLRRLCL